MSALALPERSALASATPGGTAAMLQAVETYAKQVIAPLATRIDQEGHYPEAIMADLGGMGALRAHLQSPHGTGDYVAAIQAMATVSRVCGATGFLMWCHDVCGLYMEQSGNVALTGQRLSVHAAGGSFGGTALSNPMKAFAGIEKLALIAKPLGGGRYVLNGTLPWVSHLGPGHCFGAIAQVEGEDRELMVLVDCDATGVSLRPCPSFSAMEGTGTYGLRFQEMPVSPDRVITEHVRPWIQQVRPAFVLLQCGMAVGITQGAIDSMREVEGRLGHVNEYLDDRPEDLQAELDALTDEALRLALTPFDTSLAHWLAVLKVRAAGSELCLRATQSALLHQGARGYLLSSPVQRRIREAHFVAIVTPALKHLRKEMARVGACVPG